MKYPKTKMQLVTINHRYIFAILCAAALGLWSGSSTAESGKEIQLMLIAAPGGSVYAVGAEFGGGGNSSIAVRAGGFSYSYKDGDYYEDGSGSIFGATGRFYSRQSMEGMFFGAGIDVISGGSDWGGYGYYGYTAFSGISPHAMVGYKIRSGTMSFEPSLYAASIPGKEVSAVVGLGLNIGARF